MKSLTLVGSTGSIGQNTLRVVEHLSGRFRVFALAAHSAVDILAQQTADFHPTVVAVANETRLEDFRNECRKRNTPVPELLTGEDGMRQITSCSEVDIVVSAAVGAAGLCPTFSAVSSGKTVALANKEAM